MEEIASVVLCCVASHWIWRNVDKNRLESISVIAISWFQPSRWPTNSTENELWAPASAGSDFELSWIKYSGTAVKDLNAGLASPWIEAEAGNYIRCIHLELKR